MNVLVLCSGWSRLMVRMDFDSVILHLLGSSQSLKKGNVFGYYQGEFPQRCTKLNTGEPRKGRAIYLRFGARGGRSGRTEERLLKSLLSGGPRRLSICPYKKPA